MNELEATKKVQQMADEIQHLVTRPGYIAPAEELKYALEEMAMAVGMFADTKHDNPMVFIEAYVSRAHDVIIRQRRAKMYKEGVEVNSGC